MISQIISHIEANWVIWLFAGVGSVLAYIIKRLKEQQKESRAIAEGVQALLRESIVSNYNKYLDRKYCPIYAKESMRKVYQSYHALGGNDVATGLYEKLLKMPEEPEESEDQL